MDWVGERIWTAEGRAEQDAHKRVGERTNDRQRHAGSHSDRRRVARGAVVVVVESQVLSCLLSKRLSAKSSEVRADCENAPHSSAPQHSILEAQFWPCYAAAYSADQMQGKTPELSKRQLTVNIVLFCWILQPHWQLRDYTAALLRRVCDTWAHSEYPIRQRICDTLHTVRHPRQLGAAIAASATPRPASRGILRYRGDRRGVWAELAWSFLSDFFAFERAGASPAHSSIHRQYLTRRSR